MEEISLYFYFIRLVLGVTIGFVIGLTGVGGGVLVMPALTLVLRLPVSLAVGTASLYAFVTKVYALYEHYKLKNINYLVSTYMLIGAIPACLVSANWIISMSENKEDTMTEDFQLKLKYFVAFVMILSALGIIFQILRNRMTKKPILKELIKLNNSKKFLGIFLGILIGTLMGSTSVGGGVLVIPLLIIFFNIQSSRVVGTSILIALALTLCAALAFSKGNELDYKTALIMATGSFPGVYFGSRFSVKLSPDKLQYLVIIIILIASVLMLI